MKKLPLLIVTFTLFILNPVFGMDEPQNNGLVSIAGLLKEDVARALWVNASGTNDARTAHAYALTKSFPCPTREEAAQFLRNGSGGYFQGRKISIAFGDNDTFRSRVYNKSHGPLRAEKVVQAMRDFPNKPIDKLYVSVFEEVNQAEQTIMKELQQQGQTDKIVARNSSFSTIRHADSIGAMLAMGHNPQQTEEAKELASKLANLLLRRGTPNSSAPTAPNPSPAASPKSSPPLPPKQDELTDTFDEVMGPGLRKMFGGKERHPK